MANAMSNQHRLKMNWLSWISVCLVVLSHHQLLAKISKLKKPGFGAGLNDANGQIIVSVEEAKKMVDERWRHTRASDHSNSHTPVIQGNYTLPDSNQYAVVHYSGLHNPVILVLTFSLTSGSQPTGTKLYRSHNYGSTFVSILEHLDEREPNPSLGVDLFVSPINSNMVIISNAKLPKFYYSFDEGNTWTTRNLSPSTIDPKSLLWNSANSRMALAHDIVGNQLYVTQDLGYTWIKLSDNVRSSTDYQWGDPSVDVDASVVYFNTYDPNVNISDFTVSLKTQQLPFTSESVHEFDPNLGLHDEFLLLGHYIFAQKTDEVGDIHLYVSYNRQPFLQAMIPYTLRHQNYIVSHIHQQQALVIVEHTRGKFDLYLSDITGRYFSHSLHNIVVTFGVVDLEVIEGVNGTLVANQYLSIDGNEAHDIIRTLISFDNGGNWDLVRSPVITCALPQCSLHFQMDANEYAHTGVYSKSSAPGLILAHGNTGSSLSFYDPDLYISRDGGVTWSLTLESGWELTLLDHGGLLVATRNHYHIPATELRYSCDEGISWSDFIFASRGMTVYGLVTEPGERTTTVSMYAKNSNWMWSVMTVNFTSIFPSTCSASAYYYWTPWNDRANENCTLGSSVMIERRNASICCLIGRDYVRPIHFSVCPCSREDFECDYGYMHYRDEVNGECVPDESISLEDPCAGKDPYSVYMKSRGYRKVVGDVCVGGDESLFAPVESACCDTNFPVKGLTGSSNFRIGLIIMGVLLVLAILCILILVMLVIKKQHDLKKCGTSTSARIHFMSDLEEDQPLAQKDDNESESDDDPPLLM